MGQMTGQRARQGGFKASFGTRTGMAARYWRGYRFAFAGTVPFAAY